MDMEEGPMMQMRAHTQRIQMPIYTVQRRTTMNNDYNEMI